jgi:hypothetical protein
MTMHKKLLLFIGLAISVVLAIGLFQYFEPAKDHGDQPIQKTLLATELHAAFASADSMELLAIGQVIAVQGTVQSAGQSSLVLHPGISCSMTAPLSNPSRFEGTEVKVKGRLVGFDDLFGEVQLDFGSFIEP